MNQFLVGLVERATLRVPVLERRPRSLFEPIAPAVAGPARLDSAEQAEPDDLDERMEPTQPEDAPSGSRRGPTMGGDPDARSAQIESASAAGAADRSGVSTASAFGAARYPRDEPRLTTLPSSATRNAVDERWLRSAAPSPHGELESAGLDAALAATLVVERPRRGPGRPSPMPASAPAAPYLRVPYDDVVPRPPRAHRARPATVDPATAALLPTTNAGPPASANVPTLRAGPPVSGPPALLVRSQAATRVPRADGIAAPAPVHVTIGRIEVRASIPAADRPPTRRSPAGPKLSLDDYLNGRRGGSR